MRFLLLAFVTILARMALGHSTSSDLRDDSPSSAAFNCIAARAQAAAKSFEVTPASTQGGGLWGCYMPQWSHGCAYFSPHNGCQNVHLTNDHGGSVDELHSIGPDNGTRCQVFAGADCTHPFYPIHDIPTPDWSIAYPGTAETADAVRSFKCFQG